MIVCILNVVHVCVRVGNRLSNMFDQCLYYYYTSASAPMFTEMPMDSLALVNTTLVLPCVATGHPFPTISWEVFNSPIQLGPSKFCKAPAILY